MQKHFMSRTNPAVNTFLEVPVYLSTSAKLGCEFGCISVQQKTQLIVGKTQLQLV